MKTCSINSISTFSCLYMEIVQPWAHLAFFFTLGAHASKTLLVLADFLLAPWIHE